MPRGDSGRVDQRGGVYIATRDVRAPCLVVHRLSTLFRRDGYLVVRCLILRSWHLLGGKTIVEESAGPVTSRLQDAVRLLLLIDGAAEPIEGQLSLDVPEDAVGVFRTQVALQKMDFWLRNPDYLAELLLDRYEQSGDAAMLDEARRILDSEEPEVRRYPMLRYRFGAYEPLDQAMSVLTSAGLVIMRREGQPGRIRQHNYYVTEKGRTVAREMVADVPDLGYYVDRVALLLRLIEGLGPSVLKDMQYEQPEYAGASWRTRIATIAPRVRQRLADLDKVGAP